MRRCKVVGRWVSGAATLLLLMAQPAAAVTISYPDFSDLSSLTLNNQTALIHPGGAPLLDDLGGYILRFTNDLHQGGSAFLTAPIPLSNQASFNTYFTFRISNPMGASDVDGPGADGLFFIVQTVGNYVCGDRLVGFQGMSQSAVVEFDTWNNSPYDDGDGNHAGIDLAGSYDSVVQVHVPTRMNDGQIWHSWVDYSGATTTLEVRLAMTSTRPVSADLSYVVDLGALLATPNTYFGFASYTGGAAGVHEVRSWELRADSQLDAVPEPTTLCLLVGGLASLLASRSRRRR